MNESQSQSQIAIVGPGRRSLAMAIAILGNIFPYLGAEKGSFMRDRAQMKRQELDEKVEKRKEVEKKHRSLGQLLRSRFADRQNVAFYLNKMTNWQRNQYNGFISSTGGRASKYKGDVDAASFFSRVPYGNHAAIRQFREENL